MTKERNDLNGHEEDPLAEDGLDERTHLPVEEQVAALRDELKESRREASQSLDAAQRAQADLVNYRRRVDEERISLGKYSNSRLIINLLPVVEELDLAVTHAGEGGTNSSWLEGIKLIQRKLGNLLESEGVTEIETMGTVFNPVEHEALGTVETSEFPPGYVAEAVRHGYRLHDRVIQPAQVMVAQEPEQQDQTKESSESKENEHG